MLLSICIPSYNRFDELNKLLKSISKAGSQDFNVFVVDNGSKEDILSHIKSNDCRIHIIKREKPVPGGTSCRTCLDYGDGEYRMLCLDKDYIVGEYLDAFIRLLGQNQNVSCGYCIFHSTKLQGVFQTKRNEILTSIYKGRHPSGYFIRKDVIEADRNMIKAYDENSLFYNNAFLPDLLYAQGLIMGDEAVYDGVLVEPEKAEKAKQTKSYTYSVAKNNIYFFPEGRRKQFEVFCEHLKLLNLEKSIYEKIIIHLYQKTLANCTFIFRNTMKNEAICQHHGISCKKIGIKQIREQRKLFENFFLYKSKVDLSNKQKLKIMKSGRLIMLKGYLKIILKK